MSIKRISHSQKGQALVGVLAVVAIASMMVSSLVLNSLISAESLLKLRQSSAILNLADSGLTNAIIKLQRDPDYLGETLTLASNQVIIEITGSNPKIITARSIDSSGDLLRKLQAEANFDANGVLTIANWREL